MQEGRLPLHYAAQYSKPEAMVRLLLDAYPDAAKEKDRNGKLPKDLAKTDAIKALLVAPLLAWVGDVQRKHGTAKAAVKAGIDREEIVKSRIKKIEKVAMEDGKVMAWLLATIPEYAKEKDGSGELPLHYAASNNKSEAVIKALLDAYPGAAKEKDKVRCGRGRRVLCPALSLLTCVCCRVQDGRLPLHYAAYGNKSEAVIKVLLDAYPDAAKAKTKVRCGRGRRVLCPLLSLLTSVSPFAERGAAAPLRR